MLPTVLTTAIFASACEPFHWSIARNSARRTRTSSNGFFLVLKTTSRFSVQLDFDARKPEASKASLDVDIASIDAGSEEANGEVVRKAWFDAARFPKATFTSTSVKALGPNRYELTGTMTIKGKSKTVTTPFTVKPAGNGQVFEGTFLMNRSDFGIGDGPWNDPETVAYEVQVRFKFTTTGK